MNLDHQNLTELFQRRLGLRLSMVAALVVSLAGTTGCRTADPDLALTEAAAMSMSRESVRINPGDLVQVTFPAASANNTSERVRVDGHINMPLVGDILAAGKTPKELEDALAAAYKPILQNNQVLVILASSTASIFISGAVNHPGRINMERPMTLLDGIMEAGGFNPKSANVKKVTIIRKQGAKYSRQVINLKPVLRGKDVAPFELQPFDIIFVPERIF
jgi:polysaccharide export outer membrane protein